MAEPNANGQSPVFKDRKVSLVLAGLAHVGLGCLCGLMVPLSLLGMVMSKPATTVQGFAPLDTRMMVPGLLFYGALAVWLVWTGVGAILAKRWARALLLANSGIWLVSGIGGMLMLWLLLPDIYSQMVAKGQLPQAMANFMLLATLIFMAVFYVAFPGVTLLLCCGRNVQATCEFRNPNPSWTDACPIPVLASSLIFAFWAACLLCMGCYQWAMPFFGVILVGPAGAAVTLATAVALAYAAWGSYRLTPRAWTCSVAVVLAWGLSMALTFSRLSLLDFYTKMRFPEAQLELMKPICMGHGSTLAAFGAGWLALFIGYLLFTRRFFQRDEEADKTRSAEQP